MSQTFSFQMRAYAAAHFEQDEYLRVRFPGCPCIFQSEYTGGEDQNAYPVTLFGEIRGQFEEIHEAQRHFADQIGGDLLPVISLATNAAIQPPLAIACFGADLTEPQPIISYRTPPANSYFPPGKRRIKLEPLAELIAAVGTHSDNDALRRANESFRQALVHWAPEERLLGGEFLFIAAETLSRFLIEDRAKARGMTPKNLARVEGLGKVESLRRAILIEIFDGDEETFKALERASNGFEHGYMATASVKEEMEPILEHALPSIRAALIRASGVEEETVTALLCNDYAEPRPLIPDLHFITGTLARVDRSIPASENLPWGAMDFRWNEVHPDVKVVDGDLRFAFNPKLTISGLPENVSFEGKRYGLRAGYVTAHEGDIEAGEEPPPQNQRPAVGADEPNDADELG